MSSDELGVTDLLQQFQLKEEEAILPITDIHIEDICRTQSIPWQSLPFVLLDNPRTVVSDIKSERKPEVDNRLHFFSEWRKQKGSGASYKELITALLYLTSREHAEYVCHLMKSPRKISQASGI